MSKPVVIVSCDEHTGPPAEEYRPYIEQRFHPRFDEWKAAVEGPGRQLWEFAHVAPERFDVADNEDALASGGLMGAWQPEYEMMHRPAGVYVPYTDFGKMVEDATARQAETV